VVALAEFGLGGHLLVQEPRGVRDARDERGGGVLLADLLDEVVVDVLFEEVPDVLDAVERRLDGAVALREPADGGAERHADGLRAAVLPEFVEQFEHVRREFVDVRVVELEVVHAVDAQPFEALLDGVSEVVGVHLLREFAVARLRVVVEVVAHLRRDGHLVAALGEHRPEQFLAAAVAVDVARVEVRDALVEGVLHHLDGVVLVAVTPPVGADDPRAEPDFADLDAGVPEFAVLHARGLVGLSLSGCGSGITSCFRRRP
jgi:hypothetical protein